MNIFTRKQKIVFDCFCMPCASQNPIQKASHFFPEWWKNLPSTYAANTPHDVLVKRGTMKNCMGILDLYKSGFIIPLWSDLNLKVENDYFSYVYALTDSSGFCSITTHIKDQYGYVFNDFIHFKFNVPWLISEKSGVKTLVTDCRWNILNKYSKMHIVSGVIDYASQKFINVNGFFKKITTPYQYNFESGTPLLHVIPLTDKEIELKTQVVSEAEFMRLVGVYNPNRFMKWGMGNRKKVETNKCPFHLKT